MRIISFLTPIWFPRQRASLFGYIANSFPSKIIPFFSIKFFYLKKVIKILILWMKCLFHFMWQYLKQDDILYLLRIRCSKHFILSRRIQDLIFLYLKMSLNPLTIWCIYMVWAKVTGFDRTRNLYDTSAPHSSVYNNIMSQNNVIIEKHIHISYKKNHLSFKFVIYY